MFLPSLGYAVAFVWLNFLWLLCGGQLALRAAPLVWFGVCFQAPQCIDIVGKVRVVLDGFKTRLSDNTERVLPAAPAGQILFHRAGDAVLLHALGQLSSVGFFVDAADDDVIHARPAHVA